MADKISKRTLDEINIDQIELDPLNVRTDQESVNTGLEALKASIKKVGLIHPVILTKKSSDSKYKLLVGQRRLDACKQLGYTKIPAIIINDVDDTAKKIISFAENINRTRLPYNDTIRVCDELYQKYGGPKGTRLERIALDIGLSVSTVVKYLSYRIIPQEVRDLVDAKKLDRAQAAKITEVWWPRGDKITKIAKIMSTMPKPESKNILEVGKEMPSASVDEIIAASKKPRAKLEIKVILPRETYEKLRDEAKKTNSNTDVADFVVDIVNAYIEGR